MGVGGNQQLNRGEQNDKLSSGIKHLPKRSGDQKNSRSKTKKEKPK